MITFDYDPRSFREPTLADVLASATPTPDRIDCGTAFDCEVWVVRSKKEVQLISKSTGQLVARGGVDDPILDGCPDVRSSVLQALTL